MLSNDLKIKRLYIVYDTSSAVTRARAVPAPPIAHMIHQVFLFVAYDVDSVMIRTVWYHYLFLEAFLPPLQRVMGACLVNTG